jgi:hypothetical protein
MNFIWGGVSYLESAGMSPAQIAYYQDMPPSDTIVWGNMCKCIPRFDSALLRRKLVFLPFFSLAAPHQPPVHALTDGGTVMARKWQ